MEFIPVTPGVDGDGAELFFERLSSASGSGAVSVCEVAPGPASLAIRDLSLETIAATVDALLRRHGPLHERSVASA